MDTIGEIPKLFRSGLRFLADKTDLTVEDVVWRLVAARLAQIAAAADISADDRQVGILELTKGPALEALTRDQILFGIFDGFHRGLVEMEKAKAEAEAKTKTTSRLPVEGASK